MILIVVLSVVAVENWRVHHGCVCFDLPSGQVFFSKKLDLGKSDKCFSIANIECILVSQNYFFPYGNSYDLSVQVKNSKEIQKFPFCIRGKDDALNIAQQIYEFTNIPVLDWNKKLIFNL